MGTEPRLLDPGPLVAEIRIWRDAGNSMKDLSAGAGVPYRTIRRYETGERRHVRLDCADRLSVALNLPLSSLYRS